MKILFIGDIVGKPGRRIVKERTADFAQEEGIDLVIANCENAAAGFGITPALADELFKAGIDVLTTGNHVWDKREILSYLDAEPRILRPANYPEGAAGQGLYVGTTKHGTRYAVLNLQGRVYLPAIDCPFRKADALLEQVDPDVKVRFVDFHAEVTSEKNAYGWYLDGRVSAVVGTHTHIPTADERILPARDGLPDRRRDDRTLRLRHRHGQGRLHRTFLEFPARALRAGAQRCAVLLGRRRCRRNDRAGAIDRTKGPRVDRVG